jgi:hypothetical protein
MNPEGLERLLQQVRQGNVTVEQALHRLRSLPFEDLGFASLDHHRSLRQGFPEVVLCEGKTTAQIIAIARALIKKQGPFLATRADRSASTVLSRCTPCGDSRFQAETTWAYTRGDRGNGGRARGGRSSCDGRSDGKPRRATVRCRGCGYPSTARKERSAVRCKGRDRRGRHGWCAAERGGRFSPLPGHCRANQPRLWCELRGSRCAADDAQFLRGGCRRDEYRQRIRRGLPRTSDQYVGSREIGAGEMNEPLFHFQ